MTQSIVCGGCGAEVPYGRLSCPQCGEMLASVAGVARRSASAGVATSAPEASAPPTSNGAAADIAAGQLATWPDAIDIADDLEAEDDLTDGLPGADDQPFTTTSAAAYAASLAAVRAPAPSPMTSPPPVVASTSVAPPRAVPPPTMPPPAVPPPATPGAYVPPVLQPAGPPAPARAWAGHGGPDTNGAAAESHATGEAGLVDATTDADRTAAAAKAAEFVGWLAIAGAALSLVGFLLPWSSTAVIGADGVGYFDRWGIAGPGHLLAVLATVAVLAAAILRARVPMWAGIGIPGVGLGALLIGLVWPYLFGPLGGSLGAMAVALGAAMLVGAGIAAIVVDRHARGERVV